MKLRKLWVKCPSGWVVQDNGLRNFRSVNLASHSAALMCLAIIAHETDETTGMAYVTYDQFEIAMGKSRTIISAGLNVLLAMKLISRPGGRSNYMLSAIDTGGGWAKFPCKSLYRGDEITFFAECSLRKRAELDALKLMFLFAAFRDNLSNLAAISYDKIVERTDIPRERIKRACSLLSVNGLAFPELMPSTRSELGVSHGYRLTGIEPYMHSGTYGRKTLLEA